MPVSTLSIQLPNVKLRVELNAELKKRRDVLSLEAAGEIFGSVTEKIFYGIIIINSS